MGDLIRPQSKNIKWLFLFLISISITLKSHAQKIISIHENNKIIKTVPVKDFNYGNLINKQLNQLIKNGFLTASLDSSANNKDSIEIYISSGKYFNENELTTSFTNNTNIHVVDLFNKHKKLNPTSFSKKIKESLNYMNNIGYPFAKFKFNKSEIKSNELNIICDLESGPFVTVDSLYNPEMSKKELELIYQIIKIKNKDPFNLSVISSINEKLKNTNYFTVQKPVAYEFINNKANIYCYAKNKPVNNMNGLLGLQPDSDGEVQLTGNLSLTLLNALKHGEMLNINWRKMFNSSQNLITNFALPYIFNTDFELVGNLNMIKKDSTFFNINLETKINYLISSNYSIGIVYNSIGSTNLLASNYNSTALTNFGFSLTKNKLNNLFNPTSGFKITSTMTSGLKKTFSTENNYEIEEKTTNYFGSIYYEQYFRILNRSTFKIKLNGLTTINDNLFENELSRIGGYQNLRGFDEESISVSSYVIGSLELNYHLDKGSNIFILADYCNAEKNINTEISLRSYQSIGVGLNLSLNNGFLTMIYALGREIKQPFLIRTGKIHIGFTSYF